MSKKTVQAPSAQKAQDVNEEELKKSFDSIDKDKNGYLDVDEIREFLKEVELEETYADLIIRVFGKTTEGSINFDEFKEYIQVTSESSSDPRKLFKLLFDSIDGDKSGYIDAKEMTEFLSYFGMEMSEKEAQDAIKEIDADRNGTIDFNELCQALGLPQ